MVHTETSQYKPVIIGSLVAVAIIGAFYFGFQIRNSSNVITSSQDKTTSLMGGNGMGMMNTPINDDADFIMNMIPHHQEAVDTSKYMLGRTTDPEFKQFLQNIIDAQEKEIAMMKAWHKQWYGKEYAPDNRYEKMMPALESIENDEDARTSYLHGMIMHHMGAIQMAAKVKSLTKRSEVIQFANQIIEAQNKEIVQMRNWLNTEDQNGGMMNHMMR